MFIVEKLTLTLPMLHVGREIATHSLIQGGLLDARRNWNPSSSWNLRFGRYRGGKGEDRGYVRSRTVYIASASVVYSPT